MRGRRFAAFGMVVAVVSMIVATTGDVVLASGGGGCGKPVTDETGTRVSIHNFCFGPTVVRVRPGQTVTFVNRDGFPHTVLGANGSWGSYARIGASHRMVYRFTRPGVYPYVCTYHVGMVGAVVVGGGTPHTAATTTTAFGPVVRVRSAHETRRVTGSILQGVAPASVPTVVLKPDTSVLAVAVISVGVLLTLLAVGAAAYRRRRQRTIAA